MDSQGIGQSIADMTHVKGIPQHAGAGAGIGNNQQLLNQLKQMSVNNPGMIITLQELENRMLTNMAPI